MTIEIPNPLTIERRRTFFRDYDKFVKLFGQENVDAGLQELPADAIVELYYAPLEGPGEGNYNGVCHFTPNELLGRTRHLNTFYNGNWEQNLTVSCNAYLIPHRYQGLSHPDLIKPILELKAPWLSGFVLNIYELRFYQNGGTDEFYVRLNGDYAGHRSLYVPYEAFFKGDIEAIKERNRSYLKSYLARDQEKAVSVAEGILADPVAVAFFKNLEVKEEVPA